jgi:hypothetical protein
MKSRIRLAVLTAALTLVAAGCGASSSASDSNPPSQGFGGPSGGGGSGGAGNGSVSLPAVDAGLPPEIKAESNYQSPVATGQIVWTANPVSGRVAYIDAKTFVVQTVQAGDSPTYLAAVPNSDPTQWPYEAAIVINVRSHDATLLSRTPNASLPTTKTFPSTGDANSWALSPSGRWAIAWADATRIANTDPTQGFQDIAVLDLSLVNPRPATILAVGYRPSQVAFSQDETRAFAVTQEGISVVDLLGGPRPQVTQNYALSAPVSGDASAPEASDIDAFAADAPAIDAADAAPSDGQAEAAAMDAPVEASAPDSSAGNTTAGTATGMPDVSFTTDRAFALVRQAGVSAITVVSLKDGAPTQVALPSAPTDLTLAPDGTFAVAVLRDTSTVAVLPLPGIATDPTSFTTTTIAGETIGRAIVAENVALPPGDAGGATTQTSVLLFTTASPIERLTVLTLLPTPSFRTITLHAPVLAVFPTDDGQNAIVLHSVTPTAGSSVKGAFSIVPIAQNLPAKIVSLTAPPIAVALAPTSDRALVTMSDGTSIYGVELAMMPSLEVVPYPLASPPTAVGIAAAAATGFVAQNYADGRITFIDLAGGAARTITGFELGARVVQGEGGTP